MNSYLKTKIQGLTPNGRGQLGALMELLVSYPLCYNGSILALRKRNTLKTQIYALNKMGAGGRGHSLHKEISTFK